MSGFKTKARTVELLGRKQIRDSVTALAELMKNAYDADAPWLRVEFSTTGSNQHVVIVDTGLGMSQSEIIDKYTNPTLSLSGVNFVKNAPYVCGESY